MLVVLPLGICTVEIARLAIVRQWLVLATAEGARYAAVEAGSSAAFRRGFLRVRAGQHLPLDLASPETSSRPSVDGVARAVARASEHVARPDRLRIVRVLRPQAELRGLARSAGREIDLPSHAHAWPRNLSPTEARRWLEALRIEWRVTSCEETLWPALLRPALVLWRSSASDPFVHACLTAGRVPLATQVTETTHSGLLFDADR